MLSVQPPLPSFSHDGMVEEDVNKLQIHFALASRIGQEEASLLLLTNQYRETQKSQPFSRCLFTHGRMYVGGEAADWLGLEPVQVAALKY